MPSHRCRGRASRFGWYASQDDGAENTWRDWLPAGSTGDDGINGLPGGNDGEAWPTDTVAAGLAAVQAWLDAPPTISHCRGVDWVPPTSTSRP
jgi:hypothetical protein